MGSTTPPPDKLTYLLRVDALGGLLVGALATALAGPLSRWENLPYAAVLGVALANIGYGVFSSFVGMRRAARGPWVGILAVANMCWPLVCAALLVWHWGRVAPLGILHLVGEGLYVGVLGAIEWRWWRARCA